ncbi:FecR family protein [Gaoshiqia sp. Z1-71]|uniref:FecR family protein n=1 Tax=Gaoshiqia hydrogeniformans TaxID=3290090 RepID=UPI003BF8BF08
MKEKVDYKLLRNYAIGKYSFRDLKRVSLWFEDLRYHGELRSVIEEHWLEFDLPDKTVKKDLSAVFENLRSRILEEKCKRGTKEKFRYYYARVAAVLLIPLLIYSAFSIFSNPKFPDAPGTQIEIVSPLGGRTHFQLPDGTKVSLNSGTKLTYSSEFKRNRQVSLTGEAYFNVYHDPSFPFVVKTTDLDVKVLGTKFNVAAFDDQQLVEVILEEGQVDVSGHEGSFHRMLSPDEKLTLDRQQNTFAVRTVEAKNLTAWKDGLLIFRSEPLVDVLARLGRWYNVRFEIQDKEIERLHYRATFREEPLEEVLRLISLTAPVAYEIKTRQMGDDGVYAEKVIFIRKKT